jgi:3-oxoacyl-[acyl-carrier protein] reductase
MNQLDLKGRVAVVTGGLIGIGAAIVKRLEASGAKVAVWDMNDADKTDVTDPAAIQRALDKTLKQLGRIDILVNNAGIAGPTMPVVDYPSTSGRRSSTSISTAPSSAAARWCRT